MVLPILNWYILKTYEMCNINMFVMKNIYGRIFGHACLISMYWWCNVRCATGEKIMEAFYNTDMKTERDFS